MCPPVNGSREEVCPGRHMGRPPRFYRGSHQPWEERAGTEPRPYRPTRVPSNGPMWASAPTGRKGGPIDRPGQWRRAEHLRQRSQGVGGTCSREHPRSVQQPRAIPQSPSGRQLPLHKGALPYGGRESGRTHRSAPTRSSECPATPGGAGQSPPPTERRGIRRGLGR